MKPSTVFFMISIVLAATLAAQTKPPATPDFPEATGAQRGGSTKTMFPEVRALHEMVGGGNNFVVEAGMRILRAGGNAVDAGVAATLAAAVTEEDHFSMGGEMPALIKMAGQPVQVISGIGTAPAKATIEFFKNRPLEPWETADRKPLDPGAGHSRHHHAGHVRRRDAGAREVRHHDLCASGATGNRIRRWLSHDRDL